MYEQHYNWLLRFLYFVSVTINSVVPHMSFSELRNQSTS